MGEHGNLTVPPYGDGIPIEFELRPSDDSDLDMLCRVDGEGIWIKPDITLDEALHCLTQALEAYRRDHYPEPERREPWWRRLRGMGAW